MERVGTEQHLYNVTTHDHQEPLVGNSHVHVLHARGLQRRWWHEGQLGLLDVKETNGFELAIICLSALALVVLQT